MGTNEAVVEPATQGEPTSRFGADWWERQMVRIVISLFGAPMLFFSLILFDASFGHDGLHCELGWVWDDTDDACGGFWR